MWLVVENISGFTRRVFRSWVAQAGVGIVVLGIAAFCQQTTRLQGASPKGTATSAAPVHSAPAAIPQNLLAKYCLTCHNARLHTAGLNFESLDFQNIGSAAPVLERVVRKLRAGEMPPSGMPRPDPVIMTTFVSSLETALDGWAAAHPNPGRVGLHRLNRAEYANAVRDLVDVDLDGISHLPPDDADQQGFENIAGILSVSPGLLEAYLSAAERISLVAVGDPSIVPVFNTYNVPKTSDQDDRVSEDLPFGSRGGIAVRYSFPVDAQYVVRIRLRRQLYDYIVGLGRPQTLQVRLDGELVKEFTVGGEDRGTPAPATFVGAIPGDPEWEEYLHSADRGLEASFASKAGSRVLGVSFVQETSEPEGPLQSRNSTFGLSSDEIFHGNAAIDNIAIGGPYQVESSGDSRSRRKIFLCHPVGDATPDSCAERIIASLARHAYRRPVNSGDLSTLLAFYKSGQARGGFEEGIRLALQEILSDPDFLFRVEAAPANTTPGSVYRLSDLELASRLSFFLWSSIPDEELVNAATHKRLGESAVLASEVKRMFADPRSKALVDNFAVQWLDLRKIRGVTPDLALFPDFGESLREDFERETELFLQSQIHEDHSVKELLNANYTFLNNRLAEYYGLSGVYGSHFRHVSLENRPERRGLLGQASILTLTSYPNRTSPVLRGKWLLENIFGMPPPPPPPDVPPLQENLSADKPVSMRQRMEQHRGHAECAVCHARMDPLGFALENFDAIGKWRSTGNGAAIDASASLPDGSKFEGASGLRSILLSRSDEFVRTVTEKLLSYALGRELTSSDAPAVRKIMREASTEDDRWSALFLGIVKSVPFQMSQVEATAPSVGVPKR
jgi:hypothetical protein